MNANRKSFSMPILRRYTGALLALALLAGCAPAAPAPVAPGAAADVDRTAMPAPQATPSVDLPDVQRRTLSNGLRLWIVERHDVPLVSMQLVVNAGSAAEPAAGAGLASFTAAMLDEGTTRRSALEIADEIDFLGANLNSGASYDASFVSLSTLRRNLDQALDIFADVVTNPTFPEQELTRVRNERLASMIQALDQPTAIARQQFDLRIYGPEHPYGRPIEGTPITLRGLNQQQMQEFYRTYYRPNNAHLIVVGDVRPDQLVAQLEQALGGWQQGEVPPVRYPPAPSAQASTRVYLIDKPGAAQSEIRIGHLGVPRSSEDYFPLLVMNTILGGAFTSRINLNLREDKGYTYGARSAFEMRRELGGFVASAGVQTPSTRESVIEFMKELEGIRGAIPLTEQEVEFAKNSIVRREPLGLETNGQIASRIQEMILYDLPPDYLDSYTQRVAAVTHADVERVARQYLTPERFAIVVVGDRSVVEEGLRALPYPVEIVTLDAPAAPTGAMR
ncbi:hypothetical protein BH24GEM3_BH24GEM3_24680 [soil metagenome]